LRENKDDFEMIYLRGLNGIRAIAAIAVLVDHINGGLGMFNLTILPKTELAAYGVTFFFSLSGFLITYLLLIEKGQGDISIGNFYVRRILRIWPLYFLLILIALCYQYQSGLLYYIFMLPNIPYVFGGTIIPLGHYWSLGVEEQFYLFWPWGLKYIRNVLVFLIAVILITLLVKLGFRIFYGGWSSQYGFLYLLRFDCMAIGGLGAWLIFNKRSIVEHRYFGYWVIVSWILFGFVAINRFHLISIIDHEIIALATTAIILDQAFGKKLIFNLEKPALEYLGKISFGIYMFNPFIIFFMAKVLKGLTIQSSLKCVLAYVSVFAATILVAHISYYFFEKPILSLKSRFSTVSSTN
jgi:peptidoglycan/LPS O-acetylase OafA/YrhL